MEILAEIGIIIIVTLLIAAVMRLLKQPLIIGYIISGIFVGPYFLNIVQSTEIMSTFSHMGIAFLLFIVGLSLSPKVIKEVGKVSSITGIGQVVFTFLIGFLICRLFGFSTIVSVYVAIALTFSSTIIIMKLLSDKDATGSLYGKISIGFLIIQDLIAMMILIIVSSTQSESNSSLWVFGAILKGIGILVILFLIGVYLLPKITKAIAKSQELLLLFAISWCLVLAALFQYLNFSMEIGALLAGVTLSLSPYRYEISSKMRPLRDFFLVLFFTILGSQMIFADMYQYIPIIIFLSMFVLIGNPLIVMILMGLLGYTKRNSFLAGLTVAQISEFSLILIALGVKLGHLTNEILSFITVIGLITIAGSSYMISYSHKIYPYLAKYLTIFEKRGRKVDEHKYHNYESYDIILFGHNRIGYDLLKSFKKVSKKCLVVDFDPERIVTLAREGIDCRYGDAGDSELLNELHLSKVKLVYSTISDFDTNFLLINRIRESNKKAIIFVFSDQVDTALELYEQGANYVIMPHFLGGHHSSILIEKFGLDVSKLTKAKTTHIKHLKEKTHETY